MTELDVSGVSPQRRAEYEWYRREKPKMLQAAATSLQAWTACPSKSCRRSQSCTGRNGAECLRRLIQDVLSEEERGIFQVAIKTMAMGASADDAIDQAVAMVERHASEEALPGIAAVADAPAEVEAARRYRPEPVVAPPEDDAARASRVRRLRAEPKRGLTPFPPR